MKKTFSFRLLVIIILLSFICIPAVVPLFHQGFFLTDDGEWMIIRFSAFYQAFADGQFPVRFLHRLNFDYGYPVATFLYPGFMYAGIPLHVLKISLVDTIKIILGLSLFGTTLFTYFWLAKLFIKKSAAVMGAIASLYFPYHMYDMYTRGSVGELFALLWVPFILWMIEKRNGFLLSIGIFLLILSHNTLALLFLPILFSYGILRKVFSLKQLLINFTFGVLLSAFFILPILFELSFTNFSQIKIADPFQHFADIQLIGVATILIFLFALALFISRNKFLTGHKSITRFFLLVTFIAIFFSSSLSSLFWQIIPASFIQFPFRLLSYLAISLAFLTAFIVSEMNPQLKKIVIIGGLIAILIFSSYLFMSPKIYFDKGDGYYATNDATTTVQDEYLPVWVQDKVVQRAPEKVQIIKGTGKIENILYNNTIIGFDLSSKQAVSVRVNTIYWPGWKVFVDTYEVNFSYNNPKGVIDFVVPEGKHHIKLTFGETALRLFADCISVLAFVLLLFVSLRKK